MGVTKGDTRSLNYSSCRLISYTQCSKSLPCSYLGAQVYTTYLHEPFGVDNTETSGKKVRKMAATALCRAD